MTSHHFSSSGDGWEDWGDWGDGQNNNNNNNINNNANTQPFTPHLYAPVQNQNPYSLQSSAPPLVYNTHNHDNNSINSQFSPINHNVNNQFNQFQNIQQTDPTMSQLQQQPPVFEVTNNFQDKKYLPPPPPENFSDDIYLMQQQMNLPDPPLENNENLPKQPEVFNPLAASIQQQPDPLDSFSSHQQQPFDPFATSHTSTYYDNNQSVASPMYSNSAFTNTYENHQQNQVETESNKEIVEPATENAIANVQVNANDVSRVPMSNPQDYQKINTDRDNYIVTGQLSQENVIQNTNLPPPGLSRMVVGQNENNATTSQNQFQSEASTLEISQRMVTGIEDSSSGYSNFPRQIDGEVSQPAIQPIVRVPSPQVAPNEVNSYMNFYPREADGEGSESPSSRPPVDHPQVTLLAGDRSSYFVTGGTESQSDGQRFVPGLESELSTQMQTLHVTEPNDFNMSTAMISNRDNEVEGIDVTSREEDIDGANDNSETSNTISEPKNEPESAQRDNAIDGYEKFEVVNKKSNLESTEDEKELQDLDQSNKSRSKSKKFNDSNDSDSHKSREKVEYDRNRHGHGSNFSDSRRRNEDSDEYYRRKEKKEKKRSSRGKKYSDNEDYNSDRGKRQRDRESDRDSRRRREYEEDRRNYRRERRAYGESNRDRERDRYYQQYTSYDPYSSYYQQQQQYYENLRRTNPQAYYDLYAKYYGMVHQQQPMQHDERSSMRSGYSSSNEKERSSVTRFQTGGPISHPIQSMNSSFIDSTDFNTSMIDRMRNDTFNMNESFSIDNREKFYPEDQRYTPKKFQSLHSFVEISHGVLIAKEASVTIQNIQIPDKVRKIYQAYPGPLVKQTSHKKTIIEFCEEKLNMKNLHSPFEASYSLLWSFLILIIRQNGNYTEGDISELLMKNAEEYKKSSEKSEDEGKNQQSSDEVDEESDENEASNENSFSQSVVSEELVIHRFREFLLYGNIGDALDFATDNNLWGHALFLASKVDIRQHANVMLKFANKLPYNDPLQTLYQIMSGRSPSIVTNWNDKWGDWRPHLAMIVSNSKDKPELVKKSIIALGDSLLSRGDYFGSHFCYLIADPCFGDFSAVESKIVLIGSSHKQNFNDFASDEAIMMTEIFEYARSLSDAGFNITSLAKYKFLLATRMLDYGFQLKALLYMEEIAKQIIKSPNNFDSDFINRVYSLADRLKFYDPVMAKSYEDNFNNNEWESTENQKWLQELIEIVNMGNMGNLGNFNNQNYLQSQQQTPQHEYTSNQQVSTPTVDDYGYNNSVAQYQPLTPVHAPIVPTIPTIPMMSQENFPTEHQQQPMQLPNENNLTYEYYQPDQSNNHDQQPMQPEVANDAMTSPYNYYDYGNVQQPTITMANTMAPKFDRDATSNHSAEEVKKNSPNQSKVQTPEKSKKAPSDDGNHQQSSGWFGGIFSKLSMKPKNQMILPDDKNPTILWDEKTKRWVNKDENAAETEAFKPPPKMEFAKMQPQQPQPPMEMPTQAPAPSPLMNNIPTMSSNEMPSMNNPGDFHAPAANAVEPPSQNMFKMQKGRNLKKSYVNVLSTSGQTVAAKEIAPENMQFFNPAPTNAQPQAMQFYNPNDFH